MPHPILPRPEAVIFDLDDTLVDRKASIRAYGPLFHRAFAAHLTRDLDSDAVGQRLAEDEGDGYIHRAIYFQRVLAWPEWRTPPSFEALCEHWRRHFCPAAVAMRGALDLLAALREQGIRIGMITNGQNPAQDLKIDGAGLRPYLNDVLVAGDHGVYKPEPEVFAMAVRNLGVSVRATWMVGDNPECDVWGAEASGMHAIWLRRHLPWPADLPQAGHAVEDLAELLPLLQQHSAKRAHDGALQ